MMPNQFTKIIPVNDTQEVYIPDCDVDIVGQIRPESLYSQTKDKATEVYIDYCLATDNPRMLLYTFIDKKLNEVFGCEGCPYFLGKEG